jgi:hypothetical protein
MEGRAIYVQVVMTASIIYQLMELDLEPWFLQAVDKKRRSFLWVGTGDAHGGHCAVAWDLVFQPKCLGRLGFHNLQLFNMALRMKWLWLSRTDASRPWHGLNVDIRRPRRLFSRRLWSSPLARERWLAFGRILGSAAVRPSPSRRHSSCSFSRPHDRSARSLTGCSGMLGHETSQASSRWTRSRATSSSRG